MGITSTVQSSILLTITRYQRTMNESKLRSPLMFKLYNSTRCIINYLLMQLRNFIKNLNCSCALSCWSGVVGLEDTCELWMWRVKVSVTVWPHPLYSDSCAHSRNQWPAHWTRLLFYSPITDIVLGKFVLIYEYILLQTRLYVKIVNKITQNDLQYESGSLEWSNAFVLRLFSSTEFCLQAVLTVSIHVLV